MKKIVAIAFAIVFAGAGHSVHKPGVAAYRRRVDGDVTTGLAVRGRCNRELERYLSAVQCRVCTMAWRLDVWAALFDAGVGAGVIPDRFFTFP